MKSYEILYLPVAEDDLNEIVDYLLEYSIDSANAFIDELENLENRLALFPESSAPIRDKKLRNKGYRMAIIGEHLMFYTLRNKHVYVMRILHGKRNYLNML